MAENLKYLSTVPSERASGHVADEVVLSVPVDQEAQSEAYSVAADIRGENFGPSHSPSGDHSKTVAMGALILSLALLLLFAGLIVRRRMRKEQEIEPDLVELDKLQLSEMQQRDRDETPTAAGASGDVPVVLRRTASPVVAFGEDEGPSRDPESADPEGASDASENTQSPKKTISVKAPQKPKRRF